MFMCKQVQGRDPDVVCEVTSESEGEGVVMRRPL